MDDLTSPSPDVPGQPVVLGLVSRLCQMLAEEKISYCHWKSNNALDRSANGDNDLDLLVSRKDAQRFTEILLRLGFKHAKAPAEIEIRSVQNYFGYDQPGSKWVHVHAHYRLIMGHDMTKNFHLAIEEAYLQSAVQGQLFKVPEVEFEYLVFVLRMVLKHAALDAILTREGGLKRSEQRELAYLQEKVDTRRVAELLKLHLPFLSQELFGECEWALQPGRSIWRRSITAYRLQVALKVSAFYPLLIDTFLKLWRRIGWIVKRRLLKTSMKYQPADGGVMIALVGGDGAGKSTAITALTAWLSKIFRSKMVHIGKPDWSLTTKIVRSFLKIGQIAGLYPLETSFEETVLQQAKISPGYAYLLREVCRARDRFNLYVKARRFADRGGIVIFDRFPLEPIHLMDGPQSRSFVQALSAGPGAKLLLCPKLSSAFTRYLVHLEENYYHQIALPDLVAVLLLNPEIAVQRKTEENPGSVFRRSSEIWQIHWKGTGVNAIDASRTKAEVVEELMGLIWAHL